MKTYKFGKKQVSLPENMSIRVTKIINKIRFEANLQLLRLKKEYKGLDKKDLDQLEQELFVQQVFENIGEVMSAVFPELKGHDWDNESSELLMEVVNDFFDKTAPKAMK